MFTMADKSKSIFGIVVFTTLDDGRVTEGSPSTAFETVTPARKMAREARKRPLRPARTVHGYRIAGQIKRIVKVYEHKNGRREFIDG